MEATGWGKGTLSPREVAAFCAQAAMMLKSGMSITDGLEVMAADTAGSAGKSILEGIHGRIEAGSSLHGALEGSGVFPEYFLDMVEIGEVSGKLESVMDSMSAYYEREEALRRMVRGALTYPLVMIAMMIAVIIVLVVRVMPIFSDVFAGLGAQMSGFSLAVMNFGQALSRYSLAIVISLAVVAAAFWALSLTQRGRSSLERARASFFLTRGLYLKIAQGRFASAMALMLSSGMDVDQSLEMTRGLVKTPTVAEKIAQCQDQINRGESFSQAVAKVGLFSGVYASMVSVGFKTGSVDTVMEKLAARYEEEASARINGIIAVLEPSLVAVLSVIVGMILLSVMLPLMGIMSSIS